MVEQEKCAVEGCEETELYDLTPAAWPDGTGGIYACNKHYRQVARELEGDGYHLDLPARSPEK